MTERRRQIVVELPAWVDDDGLFEAVADAAHEWEPDKRLGWDIDVWSSVVDEIAQQPDTCNHPLSPAVHVITPCVRPLGHDGTCSAMPLEMDKAGERP